LNLRAADLFKATGFDLSFRACYPLFTFMDFGGGIEHIPVVPARLSFGQHQSVDYEVNTGFSGSGFDMNNLTPEFKSAASTSDYFIAFRPLRLDLYAVWRPLKDNLLRVKPNLGFSFLTIYGYDDFCFNAGLEGVIFLGGFFSAGLGTEYKERIWKHKLRVDVNFRYVEIDFGINLEAPDFAASFSGKGLGFSAGLRFGY
jgi:hypothetical protein